MTRVIAHRGASGHRPENTLPAYALAVEQGADMIEIDGLEINFTIIENDSVGRYGMTTPNPGDLSSTPAIVAARHQCEYRLDSQCTNNVDIVGTLSLWWSCEADLLLIPEVACYDWLALVLRDRLVELTQESQALPIRKPQPSQTWST